MRNSVGHQARAQIVKRLELGGLRRAVGNGMVWAIELEPANSRVVAESSNRLSGILAPACLDRTITSDSDCSKVVICPDLHLASVTSSEVVLPTGYAARRLQKRHRGVQSSSRQSNI
jgi:hypothetical protein